MPLGETLVRQRISERAFFFWRLRVSELVLRIAG